jgi:WD40 repeat protein
MRLIRLRSLALGCITILTLLPLLASAQQGHSPFQATPSATPVASAPSEWTVGSIEVLDLTGIPVTLSPDGTLIAGIGEDHEFCIWEIDSLEASCDQPSSSAINPGSIVWSPDGTAVAYTLDAFLRGDESDLFVFELDAGTSVNLTDDGIEGSLFSPDEGVSLPVDVMPTWSHDSQSLIFVRSVFGGENPDTDLMTISRTGGEPFCSKRCPIFPSPSLPRCFCSAMARCCTRLGRATSTILIPESGSVRPKASTARCCPRLRIPISHCPW